MPPRFFVDTVLSPDTDLPLPEPVVRHVQVLRLAPGEPIVLFDGRGGSHAATLAEVGKRHALARVGAHDGAECELPYRVTLAQGIAGGDKMDWLIEKAVELGVAAIQPLQTTRAVVRLSGERAQRRQAHWQALVTAACEQCGRNRVPAVAPVAGLQEWLATRDASAGADQRLLLSPRATHGLVTLAQAHRDDWIERGVVLLIGPEGGLSPQEEELAAANGFTPVSMGPRILRTESAALACVAALNAVMGGF